MTTDEAVSEASKLLELDENWDSYGGTPPNKVAFMRAKQVLRFMFRIGVEPVGVGALPEGGISIFWAKTPDRVVIDCHNDHELAIGVSSGPGTTEVWGLKFDATEQ
jgi:hypothetical protein